MAGGPGRRPLQGHVARRAGHRRGAPRVGRAARGWPWAALRGAGPDPTRARLDLALSQLGARNARGSGCLSPTVAVGLVRATHLPTHPPTPTRPGPQSRALRAPTGTGPGGRENSRGSGIPAHEPHSSTHCSPRTLLFGLPPLPRTAPSPPAGVYRDSGRRRLFSPSTKMAAGPEPRLQRLERVGD